MTLHYAHPDAGSDQFGYAFSLLYKRPTSANFDGKMSQATDALRNAGVHAGVSSGTMIMAPLKNNGARTMLAAGEPVELARRFWPGLHVTRRWLSGFREGLRVDIC